MSRAQCCVGVDLATTRGSVAVAITPRRPTDKIFPRVFNHWKGYRPGDNIAPLMACYYDENDVFVSGYELETLLEFYEFNDNRYFPFWKSLYYGDNDDPVAIAFRNDYGRKLRNLGETRETLLKDWVHYQYQQLFEEDISGRIITPPRYPQPHDKRQFDLQIIVTIPPGKTMPEKEELVAGFAQDRIQVEQISLVTEPEALLQGWVNNIDLNDDWKVLPLPLPLIPICTS